MHNFTWIVTKTLLFVGIAALFAGPILWRGPSAYNEAIESYAAQRPGLSKMLRPAPQPSGLDTLQASAVSCAGLLLAGAGCVASLLSRDSRRAVGSA